MKKISFIPLLAFGSLVVLASGAWAQTPLTTVETVTVGDAGNAADSATGLGGVPYEYKIGKYEITAKQYMAFLNSVARINTGPHISNLFRTQPYDYMSLYSEIMRSGSGTAQDPWNYYWDGGVEQNHPITYLEWIDAARFANWLHNGATNGAATETGAYTLNGATSGVFNKNTGARWWIPSDDEWHKAAYYKSGGSNTGYWRYPTKSDTAPIPRGPGDSTNTANYRTLEPNGGNGVGHIIWVGTYTNSPGPYGTFDQGGNASEFTTTCSRGGAHNELLGSLEKGASTSMSISPTRGFRLASAAPSGPVLIIEQPEGSAITNNFTGPTFGNVLVGLSSSNRVFTVRNSGDTTLANLAVATSGSSQAEFDISPLETESLAAGAATSFSVAFSPKSGGPKSVQLSISGSGVTNSPFTVNLSGFGLGEDTDTDSDGLNDAAEFAMSALGFNWEVAQVSLVNVLLDNAIRAKLYPSTSIMDLNLGGLMIQKQGSSVTLTLEVQKTDNLGVTPFSSYGSFLLPVNVPGNKSFLRVRALPNP